MAMGQIAYVKFDISLMFTYGIIWRININYNKMCPYTPNDFIGLNELINPSEQDLMGM